MTLDIQKLAKMLGLLGSDHAGERDAAALAAHRMVRASGLQWAEILSPSVQKAVWNMPNFDAAFRAAQQNYRAAEQQRYQQPEWRKTLNNCMPFSHLLTEWEQSFLKSISHRGALTDKQLATLNRIALKVADL